MESSCSESDLEFWNSYAQLPSLIQAPLVSPDLNLPPVSPDLAMTCPIEFASELPTRREQRLKKQIEVLRIAQQVEINSAIRIAKKDLEAKHQELLLKEKHHYETLVAHLSKKIEELAKKLQEKGLKIKLLNGLLTDQQLLFSEFTIDAGSKRSEAKRPQLEEKSPRKNHATELAALKEVCKIYSLESLAARQASIVAAEKEVQVNAEREADRLKFTRSLKEIEVTIKAELEEERRRNAEFQATATSELQLRETLNARQQEMIRALQEELKSAKMVLQSTRLHSKYIEAMKQTHMEEVPEEFSSPLRSRLRQGLKHTMPLPRIDKSVDWSTSSRTPTTMKHFKQSPDATTKASSSSRNSSFS